MESRYRGRRRENDFSSRRDSATAARNAQGEIHTGRRCGFAAREDSRARVAYAEKQKSTDISLVRSRTCSVKKRGPAGNSVPRKGYISVTATENIRPDDRPCKNAVGRIGDNRRLRGYLLRECPSATATTGFPVRSLYFFIRQRNNSIKPTEFCRFSRVVVGNREA